MDESPKHDAKWKKLWFFLCKISRIGRSIETECRMTVTMGKEGWGDPTEWERCSIWSVGTLLEWDSVQYIEKLSPSGSLLGQQGKRWIFEGIPN